MNCMKKSLALGLLFLAVFALADNYFIYLAQDALPAEKTAANELKEYLFKISGENIEIVNIRPTDDRKGFFLGHSAEITALLPQINLNELNPDEIIIEPVDGGIVITGDRPRGTLYAVYSLLEKSYNVRWWSPTAESVPTQKPLKIPALSLRYTPPFYMREVYYDTASNAPFAARMKNNGHFAVLNEEYGGHQEFIGWVHTFWRLLPPEQYFTNHPEWFSLIDGQRIPCDVRRGQLCLTNSEMRSELIRNAADWLRKSSNRNLISISQNDDVAGYCQCDNCSQRAAVIGQSGVLIEFVNEVAAKLEEEFPGVTVETLAYYYTLEPPMGGVKPRANVLIRFAPINADYSRPLDGSGDSNINAEFADKLRQWSTTSNQLAVWNYVSAYNNYMLPFPNFRNWGNDLRFFAANGVKAIFQQGGPLDSELSNFITMRTWVLSQLVWDPSQDAALLIKEFNAGYYGKAAGAVDLVLELLLADLERSGSQMRCGSESCPWLTLESINHIREILNTEIAKCKDDDELLRRLILARAPFDFAWFHAHNPGEFTEEELVEANKLLAHFKQLGEKYNVQFYSEHATYKDYLSKLAGLLNKIKDNKSQAVPEFCKALDLDQWYEFAPESFRLHLLGKLTTIVNDPLAASGTKAVLKAEVGWLLQFPLPRGRWQVLASLKLVGAPGATGGGGEISYYDGAGISSNYKVLNFGEYGKDEWQWVDLGMINAQGGFIFVAPLDNAKLKQIEVERIILIKK